MYLWLQTSRGGEEERERKKERKKEREKEERKKEREEIEVRKESRGRMDTKS